MKSATQFTFDEMWEKVLDCDRKYDGLFFTAVKTTKIYCRPSCRSRKPKKVNVDFYSTMQEAENFGFRACKRCRPEVEQSPNLEFTHKVISFLMENYKRKLSLDDLSHYIGMSPSYLDRLFKRETGDTPRAYLEKLRIDKAAHLLKHTSGKNLEICYEVGFQSSSHFYKAFRQLKNHSPSEYRKSHAE